MLVIPISSPRTKRSAEVSAFSAKSPPSAATGAQWPRARDETGSEAGDARVEEVASRARGKWGGQALDWASVQSNRFAARRAGFYEQTRWDLPQIGANSISFGSGMVKP